MIKKEEMYPTQELCHSKPPKNIYLVLHEFEKNGGELPRDIENWWKIETTCEQIQDEN